MGIIFLIIGIIGLYCGLYGLSMTAFSSDIMSNQLAVHLKRPQTRMTVTKRGLLVTRYHILTTYSNHRGSGSSGYEFQRPTIPFGFIIECFLRLANSMAWLYRMGIRRKFGVEVCLTEIYDKKEIIDEYTEFFTSHDMKYQIIYESRFTLLDRFIAYDGYPYIYMYCSKEDLVALKLVHNIQT